MTIIRKVEFDKFYKWPKHYYLDDAFDYNFNDCEINESKKEALNKELTLRKEKNLSKKNISQWKQSLYFILNILRIAIFFKYFTWSAI